MRSEEIKKLRPEIQTDSERVSLPLEAFQNNTIRPILKFQNDVLLQYFRKQFPEAAPKDLAYNLSEAIKQHLQKDTQTRTILLGMVIGMFTEDEIEMYLNEKPALSKRILDMLQQRLQDGMKK